MKKLVLLSLLLANSLVWADANLSTCELWGVDYERCDKSLLTSYQINRINEEQAEDTVRASSAACAENGTCYGDINQYGVPKTIHVKGYYRKDGTYVRGHYRGKPRK